MNFGEVIKVMNNTKVFKCKREELAVNILKAAGIVIEVDMDFQTAAAKWIDRGIPKNICSYFPNAINEEELKKHIERWATDKTWKTLQRGFDDYNSKTKNQINKCIVNCSTSVREDFCQSIVVQLVESLGFPLPEKCYDKKPITEHTPHESEPERMLDIFVQGCDDFAVEGFIDSVPTTDRISDMFRFIWLIRKQDKKDSLDKNEEIYQGIVSFVDILQEYLNFLKRSSGNLDSFPDNYKLPNRDSKEFSEESNRFRERLNSLYLQIKAEVEKMELKCQEQRRVAGKEAWNTSKQIKDFLND